MAPIEISVIIVQFVNEMFEWRTLNKSVLEREGRDHLYPTGNKRQESPAVFISSYSARGWDLDF